MPSVVTRVPRTLHAAASDLAVELGLSIGEALELMVFRANASHVFVPRRRLVFTEVVDGRAQRAEGGKKDG